MGSQMLNQHKGKELKVKNYKQLQDLYLYVVSLEALKKLNDFS